MENTFLALLDYFSFRLYKRKKKSKTRESIPYRLVRTVFFIPLLLPVQKHLCFILVWISDIPCRFIYFGENIGFRLKNMYRIETKTKVTKSDLNLKTKNYSLSLSPPTVTYCCSCWRCHHHFAFMLLVSLGFGELLLSPPSSSSFSFSFG